MAFVPNVAYDVAMGGRRKTTMATPTQRVHLNLNRQDFEAICAVLPEKMPITLQLRAKLLKLQQSDRRGK